MDAKTLISPAKDWTGERWLDRIDQGASLLFVHGYITQSQRSKITIKLEKQMREGVEAGEIVQSAAAVDGEE